MGQPINVAGVTVNGDIAAFHTDRTITGQDGAGFESSDEAMAADSTPGALSTQIFEADEGIQHVFIASNQVVVRRDGGWDDAALGVTRQIVTNFFVFYRDA